jgi:hypothetical protein
MHAWKSFHVIFSHMPFTTAIRESLPQMWELAPTLDVKSSNSNMIRSQLRKLLLIEESIQLTEAQNHSHWSTLKVSQ